MSDRDQPRDGRASSYADYLHLERILDAQQPLSSAHDEMLFIIQHQTSELWMRLVLHEIDAARELLQHDDFRPAFKMLTRVARIFDQLNSAWDVLRTLTPSEYEHFRGVLGESSGLQSHQYRLIEFALGNRNPAMLERLDYRPEYRQLLEAELARPSLYQTALKALAGKIDAAFAPDRLARDAPHRYDDAIARAWIDVYREPKRYWDLYELAEKLVDLEDYFRRWRFNHVTTVERIIGMKRGTGGTAGVPYLKRMLEVELFPELWRLRGDL